MPVYEDQPISIFPGNSSSLKGMFYFLHELNGQYGSRYSIIKYPRNNYEAIDKYEKDDGYWSIDNAYNLTFSFDSKFFVTGYSLMNNAPQTSNTYPEAWQLFGVDDNEKLHLIDTRKSQNFAQGKEEVVKTYIIKVKRAYSKYVWNQTKNSGSARYVHVKHFEFFGVLCGKTGYCDISPFQMTCKIKRTQFKASSVLSFM